MLLKADIEVANKIYRVTIFCFAYDAPASAHFKCIAQHTTYSSC